MFLGNVLDHVYDRLSLRPSTLSCFASGHVHLSWLSPTFCFCSHQGSTRTRQTLDLLEDQHYQDFSFHFFVSLERISCFSLWSEMEATDRYTIALWTTISFGSPATTSSLAQPRYPLVIDLESHGFNFLAACLAPSAAPSPWSTPAVFVLDS